MSSKKKFLSIQCNVAGTRPYMYRMNIFRPYYDKYIKSSLIYCAI